MARIDTLANFLTDVATAIKSKTGKTGTITPANFDTEIQSISGGGSTEDLTTEINMYNTLLASQEKLISDIEEKLNKKIEGEGEIVLPDGYSVLPRIISSGDQYIKTGLLPTNSTGFEIDFETTDSFAASANARTLFGSRGVNYWKNAYQFTTYTTTSDGDVGGVFAFGTVANMSNYASMKYSAHMSNDKRMTVSFRNSVFTDAEGTSVNITANQGISNPVEIILFGLNDNGSYKEFANMTLYRCKFYEGDTLIRDFVPALELQTNTIGLYDIATQSFYTNSGSGKFTY